MTGYDDYDDTSIEDVLTADELHELDHGSELAMDAVDDARNADEAHQ